MPAFLYFLFLSCGVTHISNAVDDKSSIPQEKSIHQMTGNVCGENDKYVIPLSKDMGILKNFSSFDEACKCLKGLVELRRDYGRLYLHNTKI